MKQIVDQDTGEILEVDEKNELVEKKLYELGVINDQILEMIETYKFYEYQFEVFRYKLMQAMKDNNIKSWKNESFTATYKEEGIQKRLDIDRLKDDELYDKYLKLCPVKESLMIKFKERK